MAEIKIEQKKQIWPWIVAGLVIVGLLVYFLAFHGDRNNTEEVTAELTAEATESDVFTDTDQPDLSGENEYSGTIAAYVNFVENSEGMMGLDHEHTNEALLKLVDATNAKANEVGYEVREDMEKVREYAQMITMDPYETTHADNIRGAADILTNVLQNIQMAEYPDLTKEGEDLQSASESIKPGTLTLEQKDAVRNYFTKASDLLQKMN